MDTILALLIGFTLGILFVVWDNKKGQVWYKRWHDLSHRDPLETTEKVTFLYGQPFSKRLVPAVLITVVFMYFVWKLGSINPMVTILQSVVALAAVIIGFYVGPFVANKLPKGLKKANETLKKMDALESSILDKKEATTPKEPDTKPEGTNPEKGDENKKDDDWRKGIKDFLDK